MLFHSLILLVCPELFALARICHIVHWIATLRRHGCNLFFTSTSRAFFLLGNFTPNNIEFFSSLSHLVLLSFIHLFFNHFLTSSLSSSRMLFTILWMAVQCKCCYTSELQEEWGNLLWHILSFSLTGWLVGSTVAAMNGVWAWRKEK